MNKYNPSKSVGHFLKVKMYAELIGNYKSQGIKSLWDNKLDDGARGAQGVAGDCIATDTASLGGIAAADYALKTYVDNAVENVDIDLSGYALKTYVDNAIENAEVDLSGYATKAELGSYATTAYVNTEILANKGSIIKQISGIATAADGAIMTFTESPFAYDAIFGRIDYIGTAIILPSGSAGSRKYNVSVINASSGININTLVFVETANENELKAQTFRKANITTAGGASYSNVESYVIGPFYGIKWTVGNREAVGEII